MRRTTIALVVCMVVVATGTLVFRTRSAQGTIAYGPYESDINRDARVNSTDMLIVAKNFGKPVVTPVPIVLPTATPSLMATYVVESTANGTATAYCDVGDAVAGGGFSAAFLDYVSVSQPYHDGGGDGWRATWNANANITAYVVCLDNPPAHAP